MCSALVEPLFDPTRTLASRGPRHSYSCMENACMVRCSLYLFNTGDAGKDPEHGPSRLSHMELLYACQYRNNVPGQGTGDGVQHSPSATSLEKTALQIKMGNWDLYSAEARTVLVLSPRATPGPSAEPKIGPYHGKGNP